MTTSLGQYRLYRRLVAILLLLYANLYLQAQDYANASTSFQNGNQKVTISEKNTPIQSVLKNLQRQTGLRFFYYSGNQWDKEKVTVHFKSKPLEDVLRFLLEPRGYHWTYGKDMVTISEPVLKKNTISDTTKADPRVSMITGKVTDGSGSPLPGATILVKGTQQGASTDADGNFSLQDVKNNAVLIISSIGFETRELQVKGKSVLAQLSVDVNDLDEAVVVAYGTTSKRSNVGAVTVVKGEEIAALPNRSFDKSLQGLVPGLLVTNGSGQPGGGLSNFVLRGIATGVEVTAGQTVRNPLIVIDGVPVTQEPAQLSLGSTTPVSNPMAQLNPSDIESISVLKDAAAIALYGSKASNGVILVTTKRGKAGKTRISFRHQTDVASRLKSKTAVLDQKEYLDLLYETYRNTDPALWTDQAIKSDLLTKFPYQVHPNGDTAFYATPDWISELYNNHATTFINELSISGGNERSIFYLSFEYTKQDGVAKNTGYDRKSLRLNLENKVANWLKLGVNTALSYNIQHYNSTAGDGYPFGVPFTLSPLNPVREANGDYILNYTWGSFASRLNANPVAAAEYNINRNTSYRGLSKVYGEATLLKYFTFTSSLGIDFTLTEAKEKVDPRLAVGLRAGIGSIKERDMRVANLITTNMLRFDKMLRGDHSVNLLLGQEAQILTNKYLGVAVRNLSSPGYDQINALGASLSEYNGLATKQTLVSYFGQANYGYRNKYFLTSSIRTDGSSRFGQHRRFGTYWSTGLGWVVSEEPIINKMSPVLDYLKIRGSIGAAGNSAAIDRFTRYDALHVANYQNNPAVYPIQAANPGIKWEQTFTWDAGIEARLWKERIAITADIYKRKTSDLVYLANLPLVTGFGSFLSNIGDMENKGVELSISADIIRSNYFRWNINANWSTNQNKLIKANVSLASATGSLLGNEEGRNFNSFYIPVWAGVNPSDGKPMWIDSTGKASSDYGAAKREFVGKPQPDAFGAVTNTFSYKGIELSFQLYYQYGFQIYDFEALLNDGSDPYVNQKKVALDRWQKPGDQAANPRRLLNNTDGGNSISTRYLYDGDYIRLTNVVLSYTFAKMMIDRLRLNNLKLFIQGNNLAVWTKYPGQDPGNTATQGYNAFAYPSQRSFSGGLNVTF